MNEFAKIFNSAKYGQIVVMRSINEEGEPMVVFLCNPKNSKIFQLRANFPNTPKGEKGAKALLSKIGQEQAESNIEILAKEYGLEFEVPESRGSSKKKGAINEQQ